MYRFLITLFIANALTQHAFAEDSIERWKAMQDRMSYEDVLDRQREKAKYDRA
jgi:hypothetical protein